jgi:hypothetical protein
MIGNYNYSYGSRILERRLNSSKYAWHAITDDALINSQFTDDEFVYKLLDTETREIKTCKNIWKCRDKVHGVTCVDNMIILSRVELNDYRALDYIDRVEYSEIPYDVSYSEKRDFTNHVNIGKGHLNLQTHKERTSPVMSIYRYNESNNFNNCKSALFVGEYDFFFNDFFHVCMCDFGSIIFLDAVRSPVSMSIFRLLKLIIGAYPDAIDKSKITFCTENSTKIEKLDIYLTSGFKRFFTKASVLKDNYYIKG